MRRMSPKLTISLAAALLLLTATAYGQIYRYFNPGSVWTVTTIRVRPGMDQLYMEYLDGQFKRESDAQVKAGYMKSYKVLRTMDDDSSWNVLILREYKSLASMEADAEKADAVSAQVTGNDQAQIKGYEDRSKYREVLGTKTARELVLK